MRKLFALTLAVILPLTLTGKALAVEPPPWNVERIRSNLAWLVTTGTGITIAVRDTGIWYYHTDLQGKVIMGETFVEGGGAWWDDTWPHGTLVAGILAAIINDYGLIGVSPGVSLFAAKAITLITDPQDVVDALYWSANWGAQIIVIDAAEPDPSSLGALKQACDDLYINWNRLLIAGAGNSNEYVYYPAAYDSVIAVGAVDENDQRWVETPNWGSNYGPELEFVAPGKNIESTGNGDLPPDYKLYVVDSGTSYAAPHVAAVAALIYASKMDPDYDVIQNGRWDAPEVRKKLQDTALDRGSSGRDDYYGYGLVNAWYAIQRPPADIAGSTTTPPAPPDNKVNYVEVFWLLKAYRSQEGDPNYYPIVDINIDKKVDDKDLYIILANYGKIDP